MRLSYYIFLCVAFLFAALPFRVIHFLSDLLYLFFKYVFPYRRKIIEGNIERSFPEWTAEQRKEIVSGFYRNLCDIFAEGIKGFTISKKQIRKRYKFLNPEVVNNLFDKGQSFIGVGSHYANWEWGVLATPLVIDHKIYGFYKPLRNKLIDAYMRRNRKKWGSDLVSGKDVKQIFAIENDRPAMYFFGSDQSPSNLKTSHWMTFLNQDTACLTGAEYFARHHQLPIIYFDVQRVKRGHYTVNFIVLETDAANTAPGQITEHYMRTLERLIKQKPEDYLWSHRRWKHKRN